MSRRGGRYDTPLPQFARDAHQRINAVVGRPATERCGQVLGQQVKLCAARDKTVDVIPGEEGLDIWNFLPYVLTLLNPVDHAVNFPLV